MDRELYISLMKSYWKPPCVNCSKFEECANLELSSNLDLLCYKFRKFVKERGNDIDNEEVL